MSGSDFHDLPVPEAGEGMRMTKEESLAIVRPNAHRVLRRVRENKVEAFTTANVARWAGIDEQRLLAFEDGSIRPSKAELLAISTVLEANWRVILETFGYDVPPRWE